MSVSEDGYVISVDQTLRVLDDTIYIKTCTCIYISKLYEETEQAQRYQMTNAMTLLPMITLGSVTSLHDALIHNWPGCLQLLDDTRVVL
jgi:hypothetical protein